MLIIGIRDKGINMKLKDLYEQYELKKNDDVKNNHKEDIYETENYMFYYPWKPRSIIKLNPTDDYSTDYFNKHILNYNFVGNNADDKIKNLFNDHLDYFRHINKMNNFFFLYNFEGYSDWKIPHNNDNIMLDEFGNSEFIHNSKALNFDMINDIFIDDNQIMINFKKYSPNFDDGSEVFSHFISYPNTNISKLYIKFLYRKK